MDNPMIPCELCGQEISFNDYISHVNVCQHRRSILNLLNPMLNSFLFQRQMGTIVNLGSNIDFNFDNSNIQIVNIENMLDSYEVNNMISEMIGNVNHGVNNLEDAITNVSIDSILNSNDDIDKDIKCSICLDDLCEESNDKKIVKTTCNHYFHRSCITTWLREHRNCPLCQKDFNE